MRLFCERELPRRIAKGALLLPGKASPRPGQGCKESILTAYHLILVIDLKIASEFPPT